MIAEMPAFPNKMPERPSRDGFLSLDEAERLIASLKHEAHRALALFLLHTGCRIGEALKIGWEHIGDQNHLTLASENTKTQRTRIIGLNRHAVEALKYGKEKGWPSPWAGVNYWTFKDDWDRAKTAANVNRPNIVPHILRHTHASWLSQRGVPIQKISKLLGHSSIEMTMRYAKFAPNDLLETAKILE
jgi:integrase